MSQFYAMLRDSVKEAVDGWVFTTMLVLSGVMIALVASISVAPVAADVALPRMMAEQRGGPIPGMTVAADRGRSDRKAIFFLKSSVDQIQANAAAERPWAEPVRFVLRYESTTSGAAGVDVALDDQGQPKLDQLDKIKPVAGDAFEEAVRFWATPEGGEKPAYTPELATEFVRDHVRRLTGLTLDEVTPRSPEPAKADNNGLLGGLMRQFQKPGKTPEFAVRASEGSRVLWAFQPSFFFGLWTPEFNQPLGRVIYLLESTLFAGFGAWVILMAGVIITASFVPNMLRKGQIDLLISKPIPRPLILIYKYVGGLMFVLFLTGFALGGVWLVVGLRTGIWAPGVLYCVPIVTGYFAILYAVSTLVGVLTRNGLVAILLTILFWFTLFLIGLLNSVVTGWEAASKVKVADTKAQTNAPPNPFKNPPPDWLSTTSAVLNRTSPRTGDLDNLASQLIARDLLSQADRDQTDAERLTATAKWAEVVGVSLAYIALFLGIAVARFVTRSY